MKKNKWIHYTLLLGMLPVLIRFIASVIIDKHIEIPRLNSLDVIFLGLVLNITNINELENHTFNTESKKLWKTRCNAHSLLMICLLAGMYAFGIIDEALKSELLDNFNFLVLLCLIVIPAAIYSFSIVKVLDQS